MTLHPKTLTCDEALEIVSASLDGEATMEELDAMASHLVGCPPCRAAAEEFAADDSRLRTTQPVRDLPARRHPLRRRTVAWGLGLAAALMAVILWPHDPLGRKKPTPPLPQTPQLQPAASDLAQRLDTIQLQIEALKAGRELPSAPTRPRSNPFRSQRANPFNDSGRGTSPFTRPSVLDAGRRTVHLSSSPQT